jgi:hypothetical protein
MTWRGFTLKIKLKHGGSVLQHALRQATPTFGCLFVHSVAAGPPEL